jgi:soluble lytic murein transglycosylase-like protein
LLQRFHGDVRKSVAAYHAGEGAVRRHQGVPPFPDTVAYVGAVLTRYRTATSTPAP